MSDTSFWVSVWSIVGVCFITLVLTIGLYSYNTNILIWKADSCEKAVLIYGFSGGSSDVARLQLCKGNK